MPMPSMDLSTEAGQLQWAFKFAFQELPEREGARLTLREDFERFLGVETQSADGKMRHYRGAVLVKEERAPATLRTFETRNGFAVALVSATEPEMVAAREDARRFILGLVPEPGTTKPAPVSAVETPSLGWVASRTPSAVSLLATGTPRDLFLLRLMFLLGSGGRIRNVLSCPECGRPFWRVGRKKYCDRPCATKASFRVWSKNTKKGRTRSKRESKKARERRLAKKRAAQERQDALVKDVRAAVERKKRTR
jgi:hypothetical protein